MSKGSLYTALFVGFIDYLGVGLVYPLFSSMLFDPSCSLLPPDASPVIRGLFLGLLLCLMPLAQFLFSPVWGILSDRQGRKKLLQLSLWIAFLGYLIAYVATFFELLPLLLLSRLLVGMASGNTSIVQATVADVSQPEEKSKNFGLYSMALGVGFALGPFLSGVLSSLGYSIPFLFTAFLVLLNGVFTFLYFKETYLPPPSLPDLPLRDLYLASFFQMQKAFQLKGLRLLFLCSFLNYFGWSYFFEFIPVFLIYRLSFTPYDLGLFFGLAGAFYALSSGLLIRPFLHRWKAESLLSMGLLFTGLSILLIPLFPSFLWLLLFSLCFFTSFTTPTTTSLLSNSVSLNAQGEILGILASVNALALILSPLLSGSFVGNYPTLPMWIGGLTTILAFLFSLLIYEKRIIRS